MEMLPYNWQELFDTFEQFLAAHPGPREDFKLPQKIYNNLSELPHDWIWMFSYKQDQPQTLHLATLFHAVASANENIVFVLIEIPEEEFTGEFPIVWCYLKNTREMAGVFPIADDYLQTDAGDEKLLEDLNETIKEWKKIVPTLAN